MSRQKESGSVARGFIRFLAIIFVAFALSMALLLIAQKVFTPFHVVISNSMHPQIKTGDAIVIKDLDPQEIKIGQIIIYNDPDKSGAYVIHRVVSIEDQEYVRLFTTKGDANNQTDPEQVPSGEIVGGVALKVPSFGRFLDFLTTPTGYISCIGLPAALAIFMVFMLSVSEKIAERRRRRRQQAQNYFPPATTS